METILRTRLVEKTDVVSLKETEIRAPRRSGGRLAAGPLLLFHEHRISG
jgi:hypothetical protein